MDLPARIGKYELLELLGGGMSRVYRARDTVIGRTVAVKILTEQASRDPEAKARFLREAQVAGNLSHDNVISVYDFGEENGLPYMVMEFLKGEDLRSLIKDGRTGDLNWRLRSALQLARALEHIHSHKIIHRDIKPENIQVTGAGIVKLMDFGIAKAENTQLTRPGFTLGTPFYMAPEQVRGTQVGPRADIYSFGVLLFELLTGARPIQGETVERIFYEILYQPVDLKPLEQAGVPAEICDLVARCTAKDPAGRPESFTDVCKELERMVRHVERGAGNATTTQMRAVSTSTLQAPTFGMETAAPSGPRRRFNRDTALALAGLVMIVAAVWIYFSRPAPKPVVPLLKNPSGDMVLIPAGAFLAGPNKVQVNLGAFYIDQAEVSNSVWAIYCAEKHKDLPIGFRSDAPDYPIVNITFLEAQEFAHWAGKRLPTAREWEKAARGVDGRTYPWGNERDTNRANVRDNTTRPEADLMDTDALPNGASPYQVLNTLGNVWEFIDERRTPSPSTVQAFSTLLTPAPAATDLWYAIRGGAFDLPLLDNGLWDSESVPARHKAFNIGFRCAKDVH